MRISHPILRYSGEARRALRGYDSNRVIVPRDVDEVLEGLICVDGCPFGSIHMREAVNIVVQLEEHIKVQSCC